MADVPNPPKPAAKAGGKIGKALTGQKPIVYVGLVGAIIVMALVIRNRERNADLAAEEVITGPDGVPTPVGASYDGSAGYGGYAYPGASQGAWWGAGQPPEEEDPTPAVQAPSASDGIQDVLDVIHAFMPLLGGGGAPSNGGVAAHYPPTEVYTPAPAAPPVQAPPPPPPATNQAPAVAHQGEQPITGPNIFYNPDRKLRYIIVKRPGRGNFKFYESKLNRGDWGEGGKIPQ